MLGSEDLKQNTQRIYELQILWNIKLLLTLAGLHVTLVVFHFQLYTGSELGIINLGQGRNTQIKLK